MMTTLQRTYVHLLVDDLDVNFQMDQKLDP
jgi:hypothetical protein